MRQFTPAQVRWLQADVVVMLLCNIIYGYQIEQQGRGDEEQRVDAVEDAAVAGNQFPGILDT